MEIRRERVEERALQAALDEGGRVDVKRLLRARGKQRGERLILVVARDVRVAGGSVFGYADRRQGVAVVSTHRLGGDEQKLGERVEKVAAHEAGHLRGYGHCEDPRCVMHQARRVEDVDARGLELCERCMRRRSWGWQRGAVAAGVCLLLFVGMDATGRAVLGRRMPFTWQREGTGAAVLYKQERVLRLAEPQAAERSAEALNAVYRQLEPPRLEAEAAGAGAVVKAGDLMLVELDKRASGGADPVEYARGWAEKMNPLMRGKGTRAEGCPDCHVERKSEVEYSARRRARAWR